MADVRALLAAERQSRRISHPHLSYSKNGALSCNICHLNIKSEQLWPGHLKSLNHRKSVQKTSEPSARPTKRKIESVDDDEEQERDYEVDSRKKPKAASDDIQPPDPIDSVMQPDSVVPESSVLPADGAGEFPVPSEEIVEEAPIEKPNPINTVDEDEWAAFERDVAPLAQPSYTSATIEAAPVSATELLEQQKNSDIHTREDEAEAEKEDESRRMEEEFDIMEAMDDRIKRLRERREALRTKDTRTVQESSPLATIVEEDERQPIVLEHYADDSSEEEVDDWYG